MMCGICPGGMVIGSGGSQNRTRSIARSTGIKTNHRNTSGFCGSQRFFHREGITGGKNNGTGTGGNTGLDLFHLLGGVGLNVRIIGNDVHAQFHGGIVSTRKRRLIKLTAESFGDDVNIHRVVTVISAAGGQQKKREKRNRQG